MPEQSPDTPITADKQSSLKRSIVGGSASRRQPIGHIGTTVFAALVLGLGSCASQTQQQPDLSPTAEESSGAAEEKLKIVTTFLPITNFTQAVAGDRAEIVQILPMNVGPHDYQAKPADVLAIAEADVLIQNGLEIEAFLEDTIANAENADLMAIDTSEGVETLAFAELEAEHHAEGGEHHHGHERGHESAKKDPHAGEEDGHEHGEFDPHIWLDPKRAIAQVENIRDGLMAADPEGSTAYAANAAAYIEQLQALDGEISEQLAPYAGRTFVAFHDFAAYFAHSYNLKAEFLVELPEASPSPEDVRRVIDTVNASGLKTVLAEPQAGRPFLALAKDLGIGIGEFDPLETGGPEALEPEYYLETMRQNAKNLAEAFGGTTQSSLGLRTSRVTLAF